MGFILPTSLQIWLSLAIPLLIFLVAVWLSGRRGIRMAVSRFEARLAGASVPVVAGLVSAAVTLVVWGSLHEPGVIHDEQAYVVQSEIFASFEWSGPTPPVPPFFEQPHVFVEPHVAAKYPPGHSLALVPGIWLGLPGLMPAVLAGLSGGLIFTIVRRLFDPSLALMVWALWSTSNATLFWQASYLSQTTSSALWLAAIWLLERWRREGRTHQLVSIAAALGWLYLTRPLTALALAIPIGIVVLGRTGSRRQWTQLAAAAVVALPIFGLQFVWQARTTGDWLTSPYTEYSRQYFPFVRPGFGADPTPPSREVPPEIAWTGDGFKHLHAAHQVSALPATLLERMIALGLALGGTRTLLILLAVWGAMRARGPLLFGVVSAAIDVIAHLVYAHPSFWVCYYFEIFPVFFLSAGYGLTLVGRQALGLDAVRCRAAVLLAVALASPWLAVEVAQAKRERDRWSEFHRTAARTLASIPDPAAVVFVRYPVGHEHHQSLIVNAPDYRSARLWVVYDRGAGNDRLLEATDRPAYRLWTEGWRLERLR